ncbi:hypothetical protein BDP27DRAFT_1321119 [Rhodocollybia butyracea]|uniref:Uncharacterized protein n=1 Tax=Rhodocollybia butyracea TaxID=206335 RepID=A0A9P5PTL5_9AGAR|nr:hypothetical protein BDP27DRAFT_1321119 [Rhodocollybia butyracea]
MFSCNALLFRHLSIYVLIFVFRLHLSFPTLSLTASSVMVTPYVTSNNISSHGWEWPRQRNSFTRQFRFGHPLLRVFM